MSILEKKGKEKGKMVGSENHSLLCGGTLASPARDGS
jgi:hypothetical protein